MKGGKRVTFTGPQALIFLVVSLIMDESAYYFLDVTLNLYVSSDAHPRS